MLLLLVRCGGNSDCALAAVLLVGVALAAAVVVLASVSRAELGDVPRVAVVAVDGVAVVPARVHALGLGALVEHAVQRQLILWFEE